jgi:predicted GIY-YIG superfamily endonuclease
MVWVYILRGSSNRYYYGSTDNLERRIAEHQRGNNHTTRRFRGGVKLVAAKEVSSMREARTLEVALKRKKNPQLAIHALRASLE